jgi:hypothetical protein
MATGARQCGVLYLQAGWAWPAALVDFNARRRKGQSVEDIVRMLEQSRNVCSHTDLVPR